MEGWWTTHRQPFILCTAALGVHQCRWEVIDSGVAGCLVCGFIHKCSAGKCRDVSEIEDGLVCNVTGVVVRACRYLEDEFRDTVNVGVASGNVYTDADFQVPVLEYVQFLLCSKQAQLSFRSDVVRAYSRLYTRLIANLVDKTCVLRALEMAVVATIPCMRQYNTKIRQTTAVQCSFYIERLLAICRKIDKNCVKRAEFQAFVLGVLYLMRSGLTAYDVCLLPKTDNLKECLPYESNLLRYFGLRAKTLTDVENKIKFLLRQANACRVIHDICMDSYDPYAVSDKTSSCVMSDSHIVPP